MVRTHGRVRRHIGNVLILAALCGFMIAGWLLYHEWSGRSYSLQLPHIDRAEHSDVIEQRTGEQRGTNGVEEVPAVTPTAPAHDDHSSSVPSLQSPLPTPMPLDDEDLSIPDEMDDAIDEAMDALDDRDAANAGVETPSEASKPITRVTVPSIALDAEVVPAAIVPYRGGTTWEVPSFRVGHAESTAGAGQEGNGILLGHVSGEGLGDVFAHLERVVVGDRVGIFSDDERFEYRVVAMDTVDRADVSVIEAADTATITMITCTGEWLPDIEDFSERLIVRAELVSDLEQ